MCVSWTCFEEEEEEAERGYPGKSNTEDPIISQDRSKTLFNILASGGSDCKIKLWILGDSFHIDDMPPCLVLSGHSDTVRDLKWCRFSDYYPYLRLASAGQVCAEDVFSFLR